VRRVCPLAETANVTESTTRKGSRGSFGLDLKLWLIEFEDIEIQREIGEGSFGKVGQH
jgi:hypothetical protein